MQQAQLQLLAVELLSVNELQHLFTQLKTAASETNNELLITAPAHLFQVDTSFVYDGDNACFLIHVPMNHLTLSLPSTSSDLSLFLSATETSSSRKKLLTS
jgi:hypothetical protein